MTRESGEFVTMKEIDKTLEPQAVLSAYLGELGRRILALRKARAMSQQSLADAANLDRTYISAVEHGKQNVTIGAVAKLSSALKISLHDLLVGPN